MKKTSVLMILTMLAILAMATLTVSPAAASRPGDNGFESCSISCTLGGGCSAYGPAPCTCRCSGFLGLGGPRCSCGGGMFDNPVGD